MLGIGIVDDRQDQREEISETFELALSRGMSGGMQGNYELFPSVPLPNLRDYPFWIIENKITALIIDQRLKEVPTPQYRVDYDGHEVVKYLRPRMRNLPIVIVTGYQDDVLEDIRDEVTEIIGKDELGRRGNDLTKEILEKAEIYKNDYTTKLARIDELAQRVALGKATSLY
jgi:CheY-like chemotaxis protein